MLLTICVCMSIWHTWLTTNKKLAKKDFYGQRNYSLSIFYRKALKMSTRRRRVHNISDTSKQYLKNKAIQGALYYNNCLIGKHFLVICEDGTAYKIQFFKKDFQHLTGLKSNLNEDNFFKFSKLGLLNVTNIHTEQKYDWPTLKQKADRISQIHKLLYEDIDDALFLINLHTQTRDYPIAIKSTNIDACVGFEGDVYNAKTLRKYSSSNNYEEEKRIVAILSKDKNSIIYDTAVYCDIQSPISIDLNVLNQMSNNIKRLFETE